MTTYNRELTEADFLARFNPIPSITGMPATSAGMTLERVDRPHRNPV